MSELIDRVVDVATVSKEISDTIANLNLLNASIEAVKLNVTSLADSTRKAKVGEDLVKNSKSLNDEFVKGGQVMKAWEIEVAKLNEKTEKLTTSEKAASIEIAKARLELAAANKATKEAAIADIEKAASNGKLSTSYNALEKDLKASIKAYRSLEEEEKNSAKGKELLNKITSTNDALKKSDAAMGNYQRNVGNYSSALEGLTPRLSGLAGTLVNIATAAKENAKNVASAGDGMEKMGGSSNVLNKGLSFVSAGFKGIGQSVVAMGKVLLSNPILLVAALIVGIFKKVSDAINESEERSNKLSLAMAKLAPIGRTIGDVFEVIADGFIKFVEVAGNAIAVVTEFLHINPKGSADQFAKAEKMKQDAIVKSRGLMEKQSKLEADIETQRAIVSDKEQYSFAQRLAAQKKSKAMEIDLANTKTAIMRANLNAVLAENALDDNNAEANDRKRDAVIAFNKAKQEGAALSRKLSKDEQKLIAENNADLKEQAATAKASAKERADAAKAASEKIIAAHRRLVDSQFAIQEDSEQKSLAQSAEAFKRELEDLQKSGDLTKELKNNLTLKQEQEQAKIKSDWSDKAKEQEKKTNDEILASELKRIDDIQKGIEKQTEDLSAEYAKQERDLKKQYANGEISEQEYQDKLAKLKLDALYDVNNKQIASLEKLLKDSKLTDDKRAELSKKLADLKIANEEAVTDAIIAENEKQVAADADGTAKREAVAVALANATKEIFAEIANFATQQSEQREAELEAEQDASDATFEVEQDNLDNALMSDENRALKQKELTEKKAAADKVIADKIQAEKIKQAKWDKANSMVQAVINTGLAILEGSKQPIPLNIIAMGLAATVGAVQLATIASQQIPAYEKGTDNHPGGLSLWGEKRAEVAVLPTGETFLATKPTVTNFDAGTKIYDSVQAYENAMGKQAIKEFVFDYDKFAEKMPRDTYELNGNGSWTMINKQQQRRTVINRRCKR